MKYLVIHHYNIGTPVACFDTEDEVKKALSDNGYIYDERSEAWNRDSDTSTVWICNVQSNELPKWMLK